MPGFFLNCGIFLASEVRFELRRYPNRKFWTRTANMNRTSTRLKTMPFTRHSRANVVHTWTSINSFVGHRRESCFEQQLLVIYNLKVNRKPYPQTKSEKSYIFDKYYSLWNHLSWVGPNNISRWQFSMFALTLDTGWHQCFWFTGYFSLIDLKLAQNSRIV